MCSIHEKSKPRVRQDVNRCLETVAIDEDEGADELTR